jgi:predicted alpha-1,2-mannosidase
LHLVKKTTTATMPPSPCRPPLLGLLAITLAACSAAEEEAPPTAPPHDSVTARLVDPFIGTAGEGYTFPGAVVPWGMASPSPHTVLTTPISFLAGETFAPSGYKHGEASLYGLGMTHLSGVGCPDLGVPVVVATTGEVKPWTTGYKSAYSGEVAWPGYYAVSLEDHPGVRIEATATQRAALLRVRFPAREGGDANLLVDAGQGPSWWVGHGTVKVVSASEVEGSSESGLFCFKANKQTTYFVARFSRAADEIGTWKDHGLSSAASQSGTVGAYLRFRTGEGEKIEVAVGLSVASLEGARANLEAELAARSFDEVRQAAFDAWESALGRILVSGGTPDDRTIFYTALYHALLHPNVLSDVDGRYPTMRPVAAGRAAVSTTTGTRYSTFSMWDTYRNLHLLLALLFPDRQLEMLRSLAAMTKESGSPPLWELASNEVNMMVGDPVIAVVAGSYLRGLTDFDVSSLYASMRSAALDTTASGTTRRPGNASYRELGYVPMEENGPVWGPVSTTLEYALDDFALGELAAALGKERDARLFRLASKSYANLFDPKTRLLRPRQEDGTFTSPFDPNTLNGSTLQKRSGGPGYVEGTAWQYAYFVPHDVAGLVALHGGEAAFVADLQRVFDDDKFTLWNEPDIAFPYLFTYLDGQAWRTQREVARARARFFTTGDDGLPGNDDAGTLSSWLVFSAMGFYPDNPASTRYSLASPLFDRVVIQLDPSIATGPSSTFTIEAERESAEDVYVSSMTLDGKTVSHPALTHAQIVAGGVLHVVLSSTPTK